MAQITYNVIVKCNTKYFGVNYLKFRKVHGQNGLTSLLSYLNKDGRDIVVIYIYNHLTKKYLGYYSKNKGWNYTR